MRLWVSARMETSAWMVMALPPAGFAFGFGVVGLLGVVAVVDDDGCAFAGEADGDGLADAGARAGDDGDFILQGGQGALLCWMLFEMQTKRGARMMRLSIFS